MPVSKRQNKVVENTVIADDDDLVEVDIVPDEDADAGEHPSDDDYADESSDDGEDEDDFGVEKDDDDEEDAGVQANGDDEEDEMDEEEDEEDEEEDEDEEADEDAGTSSKKKGGAAKAKIKKHTHAEETAVQYGIDSDDDDEVEYEKFDDGARDQYLLNFHPEARAVNFDEVKSLCTVMRDGDGDIVDDFHTTIPILTKYEKARVLGLRAKQLNSNIRPMIPVQEYVIDSYRIAEMELSANVIPFIIRRPLPDGRSEYWRIQDLTCVY